MIFTIFKKVSVYFFVSGLTFQFGPLALCTATVRTVASLGQPRPALMGWGFFGHCSGDSEIAIDKAGNSFYSTGPHHFSQGSTPCLDRVNTCQTRRRVLSTSRTSQHLNVCLTAVTSSTRPAHDATSSPLATKRGSVRCTTSAISPRVARLTFS